MNYNAQYFIDKFEAIPANKWAIKAYNKSGRCCALGHCGEEMMKETQESIALRRLSQKYLNEIDITDINDGKVYPYDKHRSAKARVLAALRDIQQKGG